MFNLHPLSIVCAYAGYLALDYAMSLATKPIRRKFRSLGNQTKCSVLRSTLNEPGIVMYMLVRNIGIKCHTNFSYKQPCAGFYYDALTAVYYDIISYKRI